MRELLGRYHALMPDEQKLLARWDDALDGGGAYSGSFRREVGQRLLDVYRPRPYHNLEHLQAVLDRLDELHPRAQQAGVTAFVADTVVLAAFYHDLVVESEHTSAQAAQAQLQGMGMPAPCAGETARLVEVTATHTYRADDIAAGWLCDADLGILAATPSRYREYLAAVRAEYVDVSPQDWRCGRSGVLEGLLSRRRLFLLAGPEREEGARANLRDAARQPAGRDHACTGGCVAASCRTAESASAKPRLRASIIFT